MPATTAALSTGSTWVPWWELVRHGEAINVTVDFDGPGRFGLLAGVGDGTWAHTRTTTSGRITLTLPATTGGLWRLVLTRSSGRATATVTVATVKPTTTAKPTSTTTKEGAVATLFRLKTQRGDLPAGTFVRCKGEDVPAGDYPALLQGLPTEASLFAPDNVFRIRTDTYTGALHPESDAIVAELARQVAARNGGNATMNTHQYGHNLYVAAPGTPTIEVKFKRWENKLAGYKPPLWEEVSMAIPMPSNAIPSVGTDRALSIWDPARDEVIDLWKARPAPGRAGYVDPVADAARPGGAITNAYWDPAIGGEMQASQIGVITNASAHRGVFDDDRQGYHYGTSATSISYSGSSITLADVASGSIEHALALQVTAAAPSSQFYWPALRSDGGTAGNPIREGQRLRLDPTLDVDSLNLTPIAKMIARAAQRYGFLVTDKAGTVAITGEYGGAVIQADGTTLNPWTAGRIYPANTGGMRWQNFNVLRGFPWNRLQAMPPNYGLIA